MLIRSAGGFNPLNYSESFYSTREMAKKPAKSPLETGFYKFLTNWPKFAILLPGNII